MSDPTGYVLAVADQREQRAKAATRGCWGIVRENVVADPDGDRFRFPIARVFTNDIREDYADEYTDERVDAEHIAAEADPGHVFAEVALWRGIADRHRPYDDYLPELCAACHERPDGCAGAWPCPDLLAVVAAAKAYAEGATHR